MSSREKLEELVEYNANLGPHIKFLGEIEFDTNITTHSVCSSRQPQRFFLPNQTISFPNIDVPAIMECIATAHATKLGMVIRAPHHTINNEVLIPANYNIHSSAKFTDLNNNLTCLRITSHFFSKKRQIELENIYIVSPEYDLIEPSCDFIGTELITIEDNQALLETMLFEQGLKSTQNYLFETAIPDLTFRCLELFEKQKHVAITQFSYTGEDIVLHKLNQVDIIRKKMKKHKSYCLFKFDLHLNGIPTVFGTYITTPIPPQP